MSYIFDLEFICVLTEQEKGNSNQLVKEFVFVTTKDMTVLKGEMHVLASFFIPLDAFSNITLKATARNNFHITFSQSNVIDSTDVTLH